MRRSLTGRADLVDALSSGLVADPEMAALLGFDQIQQLPDRSEMAEGESLPAAKPTAEVRMDLPDSRLPRKPVPFLRAKRFELVEPVDRMDQFPDEDAASANESTTDPSMRRPASPAARPAEFAPLGSFTEVFTRLRGQAVLKRPGRQPDLRRIVEELSQCRELHRVPLLSRKSWRGDLHVVLDLTRRLVPFRQDQRFISDRLKKYLAQGVATISVLREGHEQPVVQWPEAREGEWLEPNPDSTILALSDLGAAQLPGGLARWSWLRMGRRWRAVPCRLLALVPCRVDRIPADLLELWEPVAWERGSWRRPTPTDTETEDALELLIGLTSRAVRVEPELLRAIRRLFARGARDPGLEALFWQSADLTNHCSAASFREETLREYRKRFPGDQVEYAELERRAFALIKGTHVPMYAGIWATEMLNLGAEARRLASKEERMQAREWYEAIEKAPDDDLRGEFFRRASSQLSRQAYGAHPTLNRLVKRWIPEPERPDGFDASTADSDREERVCHLYQSHDQLTATVASEESKQPGSWLGALRFRDGHLKVVSLDEEAELPEWVDRTGSDEFGLWVEFSVSGVTQRMRWMPAGTFEMGSTEDDSEAYSDEKPRHKVQLSRGFWLFDTPCTQALWEAVMGENPSLFKGPKRPVENVSWEDCQTFMERLNRELPGIDLGLPMEAQWEYACRAGISEPRYHPDLDAIAWYGKNSSSTTHDVGGKLPNPWGLYDMLGNVDEWCRDPWRSDYSQESPDDSKATNRVIRGGSWYDDPQNVRAAYRDGYEPGERNGFLGFRCASSVLSESGEIQ